MNSNTGGARRGGGIARGPQPSSTPPPPREGPRAEGQKVFARIVDRATNQPISGARYEVVDAQGNAVAQGTTDWQGTVCHDVPQAGQYTVRVVEVPQRGGGGGSP